MSSLFLMNGAASRGRGLDAERLDAPTQPWRDPHATPSTETPSSAVSRARTLTESHAVRRGLAGGRETKLTRPRGRA